MLINIYNQWNDILTNNGKELAYNFCRMNSLSYNSLYEIKLLRNNFKLHLINNGFINCNNNINNNNCKKEMIYERKYKTQIDMEDNIDDVEVEVEVEVEEFNANNSNNNSNNNNAMKINETIETIERNNNNLSDKPINVEVEVEQLAMDNNNNSITSEELELTLCALTAGNTQTNRHNTHTTYTHSLMIITYQLLLIV